MTAISAAIGFLMLVLGRQYYQLFVGGMSFIIAAYVASTYLSINSIWRLLPIALAFGVTGGFLTYIARRFAAYLAGFAAGAFLVVTLPVVLGGQADWATWVVALVAGLVCLGLMLVWFDLSVIVLSTLVGTTLLFQALTFPPFDRNEMFFLLVLFGLLIQWVLLQYGRSSPD